MKGMTVMTILGGLRGFALSLLILVGGRRLIHGIPFADGIRNFWNWAISAMAGISCGYSYSQHSRKEKNK